MEQLHISQQSNLDPSTCRHRKWPTQPTMELAVAPLLLAALAWVLALADSMVHKALTVSATPRHPSPAMQSTMLMANPLAPAQELVLGPPQVATTAMALAWAQALVTMAVERAVTRPTTLQVGFFAYMLHVCAVLEVPRDHPFGSSAR